MDEQRKELHTWMFDDIDCRQLQTDVVSADPWSMEPSSEGSNAITDDAEDFALSSKDFSSMSAEQCEVLAAASDTTHNTATAVKRCTRDFEVDHTYLNKLERRLQKLYKLSGKAEKASMLKQMSDRVEGLFSANNERVDSSVDTQPLKVNPIAQRLFPDQQALSAEEKVELVKSDHLSIQTEECEDETMDTDQKVEMLEDKLPADKLTITETEEVKE